MEKVSDMCKAYAQELAGLSGVGLLVIGCWLLVAGLWLLAGSFEGTGQRIGMMRQTGYINNGSSSRGCDDLMVAQGPKPWADAMTMQADFIP